MQAARQRSMPLVGTKKHSMTAGDLKNRCIGEIRMLQRSSTVLLITGMQLSHEAVHHAVIVHGSAACYDCILD